MRTSLTSAFFCGKKTGLAYAGPVFLFCKALEKIRVELREGEFGVVDFSVRPLRADGELRAVLNGTVPDLAAKGDQLRVLLLEGLKL